MSRVISAVAMTAQGTEARPILLMGHGGSIGMTVSITAAEARELAAELAAAAARADASAQFANIQGDVA